MAMTACAWVSDNAGRFRGRLPIRVVGDVTRAGYNLLNGRSATDGSPIDSITCGHRLSCQTWSSPDAAEAGDAGAGRTGTTHLR